MRTAAICPTCATFTNAVCVIYNGPYLSNIGVSPMDDLEKALGLINDNLVPVVGTLAPTQNSTYLGQFYINSTNGSIYYSIRTGTGASDWVFLASSGVVTPPTINSVLNQALTNNTNTQIGPYSLNFVTTNYPNTIFTVQDGQVLIGDTAGDGNGTSVVVDDNLETVIINGNNGVVIGGTVNGTEINVDDNNQTITVVSGNGMTLNGNQVVTSVNGIFATTPVGNIVLPSDGIDDVLAIGQALTSTRDVDIAANQLNFNTLNYSSSFLSIQDGIIFFGDSGGDVNSTFVMVDDSLQQIAMNTGGRASMLGSTNNTEITMDDGIQTVEINAANWATINGDNIAVSVNGVLADATGDITIPVGTPTLQQVLDNNHDLLNGINLQGTLAGDTQTGVNINAFGDSAAYQNTGNGVNAIGANAGYTNTGSYVTIIGENAGISNTGDTINAIGYFAGYNNIGTFVDAIGNEAARLNQGDDIAALGNGAAYGNSGNKVIALGISAGYLNSLSGMTIISNLNLPSYLDFTAASAAINVGTGASAGCTYLYHDQTTNSIGAVRIP